jgi:uncharacterized protein
MEKSEIAKLIKAQTGRRFYVYQLSRPNGTPFYIGKGVGNRVFCHENDARGPERSHKLNVIRQIHDAGQSIRYGIVAFFDCESECHLREIEEILRIGRHDLKTGPLTNLTAGGEGACGLSDETRARIDADLHGPDAPGERGIANRFYLQLRADVSSVPVRPLGKSRPRALSPHEISRNPTPRMAAALAASAIANRVVIAPGCIIPRRLEVEGKPLIIEFGASTNLLEAGLATLVQGQPPTHEQFLLTDRGFEAVTTHIDRELLVDAGVLMPLVN